MKSIDAVGVGVVGIGTMLIYGGIKGYSFSAVLANLVVGKPITTGVGVTNPLTTPGSGTPVADSNGAGPVPTGGNQSIGQQLASDMGWEGADWSALVKLWNQESGWNNHADNPSSHAYGIPQAAALDFYTTGKPKNPGWKAPTDSLSQGAKNTVATGASALTSGLGLNDDQIRSWLIRIGEILLGLVLVGVGVAKLTGTANVISSAVKAKI
jgi:hypothetical protein